MRVSNRSRVAKEITDAALVNMDIMPIGRDAYNSYRDIGEYAMSNRSELIAQATYH